jgi:histidinol phosphatase-like PHP family hydrolase
MCGRDKPEAIVEAAIAGGIELFGISDHNHGIIHGRRSVRKSTCDDPFDNPENTLYRYYDHINLIKEKYEGKIKILRGIEICTSLLVPRVALPDGVDVSFFDYGIIECLAEGKDSTTGGDLFSYAEKLGCPCGIAHTDMFAFIESIGEDPYKYFKRMAEAGIFWEMNVSYDSTHHYREHKYMLDFFADREKQELIRESGVRLSVGFDGHKVEDYRADRVREACAKITKMGIKLAFEE